MKVLKIQSIKGMQERIFVLRALLPSLFLCLSLSCSQASPTVIVSPATGTAAGIESGTLYPMIQGVYPGALQSLDIPDAVPSGVSPSSPGMSVVFSQTMASVYCELVDDYDSSTLIPLAAFSTPDISFNIIPQYDSSAGIAAGSLKPNTPYTLRIWKTSYAQTLIPIATVARSGSTATVVASSEHGLASGQLVSISGVTSPGFDADNVLVTVVDTTTFTYSNTGSALSSTVDTTGSVELFSRTLVFSNLVESPATSLDPADPDYVEYKFETGTDGDTDTVPPALYSCIPSAGAINVNPASPAGSDSGGAYIQFVFKDNSTPMIDPSTVNNLSVTLYNDTGSTSVSANSISLVSTDTDYKTFRFYVSTLDYSKHYTLSIGNPTYKVCDFSGNSASPVTVGFTTMAQP